LSNSTGVRKESTQDSRIIRGIIENERLFVESLSPFAGSGISGIGSSGQRGPNSVSPAGNSLNLAGGVMRGPFGNDLLILEIVSDQIEVSKASGNDAPYIVLNPELGLDDDLVTIIPGTGAVTQRELWLEIANKTITFKTTGNIFTPSGTDFAAPAGSIIKLIFSNNLNGWVIVSSSSGIGSGSSDSFPLRYPLSAHGSIGLVTEIFDWDFHGHTATLTGDISVSFSNLPLAGFGEDIKLHFLHDGLAGNRIITFPGTVNNLTTVTIAAGQDAIIVLTTDDAGVSFHAYSESGISSESSGLLSNLTIDVDKDWNQKNITNLGGIFFDQANQTINPSALGIVYATAAQKSHSFFAGITEVARFEETTPGNYINQFLAILNMNGNEINQTKHIAFDGLEGLVKTTESGIGMDNITENAMIYNVPLTTQSHNFKAAGELLVAISRVGTNSGLLSVDNIQSDRVILDELLELLSFDNVSPVNGQIWRESSSGILKARQNGITENLIGVGKLVDLTDFTPDLVPITGDLIVRKDDGTFHELLKGADGKILTANSASSNGLGLEWQTSPAADNLGSHVATQFLDMDGNSIDNILRSIYNANAVPSTGREIAGTSDGLFLGTANTKKIVMAENGQKFLEMDASVLKPSIDNVLSLGELAKRFSAINAGSGDFSDTLLVSGDAEFESDVFIGNSINDELSVTAKIVSDLKIDDGKVIKPNIGEIGFYVKRIGTIGSEGAMGVPFDPDFESTASAADISYGNSLGSLGVYGRGGDQEALLVIKTKTSPSTWRGVLLNDITLT